MVHHADYLEHRDDHALCGAALASPAAPAEAGDAQPCPDCESRLVLYHLEWWREKALAATAELDELRAKYGVAPEPPPAETPEPAETEPAPQTLLDRARRELTELCRQFDGAVPFVRLKKAMQDFSDGLDTNQRVQLAQEIGGDGTLIRWSTNEVETLGWQVTNNPMKGETEASWDAWIQDSYQTPAKTKRRFGRSR